MLLTCRRCGRPYCAECLLQTHAGLHCHECAEVIRSSRPAVSKPTTWLAVLVGLVAVGVVVGAGITGLIDLSALDEWLPGRVQTLARSSVSTPADAPTQVPASTESQRVTTPIPAPTVPIENRDKSAGTEPSLAEAAYNRGNDYLLAGNYDSAIQAFTEAIRLNPNHADAYNSRGLAYWNKSDRFVFADKGEYDRAIQDFDQAIRLNPNDADIYANRGRVYHRKRELDRAIRDYDQAIRLDPNSAAAYTGRGNVYGYKRELDRAIQDYDQAIWIAPNESAAYGSRGLAYAEKGEDDRAIQDFSQAIRLNPKYDLAYYERGLVYMGKGQYDRARSDFNKLLELGWDRAEVEAMLAQMPD